MNGPGSAWFQQLCGDGCVFGSRDPLDLRQRIAVRDDCRLELGVVRASMMGVRIAADDPGDDSFAMPNARDQ
jgi:hypothetical protein